MSRNAAAADAHPTSKTENDTQRLSLRLSPEARAAIDEIMELNDARTVGEAVRRAIGTELYLLKARKAGSKILVRDAEGAYTEIVLR